MVRRRARIRFEGLPEDAERIKGREATPAQVYDDTHLDHDVQTALDALLPEYRAAVVLCDIEGLTYEEIADVLGIKIGTVRSRIHRGRTQLRAALAHRPPARRGPRAVLRRGAPSARPRHEGSPPADDHCLGEQGRRPDRWRARPAGTRRGAGPPRQL